MALDLTGKMFGQMTAINCIGSVNNQRVWRCQCSCGSFVEIEAYKLNTGKYQSCGCLRAIKTSERRRIDISGQRFGSLVATSANAERKQGHIMWNCACDCGGFKTVKCSDLRSGHVTSCGCGAAARAAYLATSKARLSAVTKHNSHKHPDYMLWAGIVHRCTNPRYAQWAIYGGRGISVCDRWKFGDGKLHGFECFLIDMGARPSSSYSIDRINNDGNYEPSNCRWATAKEQASNRRASRSAA